MADRITTSRLALSELPAALSEILTEYQSANFETRQEALQAGAEVFKSAVEGATPIDTGEMARSWQIKDKYKDRRYVGNTRVATGKVRRKKRNGQKGEAREGVPLSNVLEYGEKSPHNGFIRRCFDSTEPQIFAAIKNTLENGGNNQ